MSATLFYKESTPVALNELLLTSDYFKEHYKLVPSVVRTLNTILGFNQKDGGKSSITWTRFFNRWGQNYPKVISALECLSLLKVTRISIKKSSTFKGLCYSYEVTERCLQALRDTNRVYLYKLLTDKSEIRKTQKKVSDKRRQAVYGDIRDYHQKVVEGMVSGIKAQYTAIDRAVSQMPAGKAAFTYSLLIDIIRRDYKKLEYNEKDGRVWTPYAQLPAEIKKLIGIHGLEYQQTIDIRSCYPSLWAEYVCYISSDKTGLDVDRRKYNQVFLNKDKDPKAYLASLLGIDRAEIKEVLIKYFNGYRYSNESTDPYFKFNKWLASEYPHLYRAWKNTNIKQTGNNIGKHFETRLMLDKSIYQKAESLGIVIGYEYDGMSFYAADNSKCGELLRFIEQRSSELLGIQLVFVIKNQTEQPKEINMKKTPIMPTDTHLYRLYAYLYQTAYDPHFTPYERLPADTQAAVRKYVTSHREELEIEYLKLRSEAYEVQKGNDYETKSFNQ